MLTTDDIREHVFGPMRTAYGGQWKHGPTAERVWRNALSNYSVERIQWAANEVLTNFVNHPPTLPQFMATLRAKDQRPTTYLPAPSMPPAKSKANRILLRVLLVSGGVDEQTLTNLVALKNALVEECRELTVEWIEDTERQLSELANPKEKAA